LKNGPLDTALRFAEGAVFKLSFGLPGTTVNFEINTADTQPYHLGTDVRPEEDFLMNEQIRCKNGSSSPPK